MFEGFLGGPVLYANPEYVAPRMANRQKNRELEKKFLAKDKKMSRKEDLIKSVIPTDDIEKLYDNKNFFEDKNGKGGDNDSDLYEENDDDYDL